MGDASSPHIKLRSGNLALTKLNKGKAAEEPGRPKRAVIVERKVDLFDPEMSGTKQTIGMLKFQGRPQTCNKNNSSEMVKNNMKNFSPSQKNVSDTRLINTIDPKMRQSFRSSNNLINSPVSQR